MPWTHPSIDHPSYAEDLYISRPCREDFAADIVFLQFRLAKEDCLDTASPTREALLEGVTRGLQTRSYYCAEMYGHIIGCARVQYMESDWEAKRRVYIDGVYVMPDHRHRKVGRRLIQTILDDHADACDIQLAVKQGNVAATALYKSLGFLDDGYITLTRRTNAVSDK